MKQALQKDPQYSLWHHIFILYILSKLVVLILISNQAMIALIFWFQKMLNEMGT